MVNISAAMARPLADTIIDMVETIRKLGPNPLKKSGVEVRSQKPRARRPKSEIRNRQSAIGNRQSET